jgi:hypothetical protein
VQTAVASLALFWLLGWSALGGVAFLGAAIATTKWLVARIKHHQRGIEKCRDNRVNLLSEVLTGIRVVKMNTWERPFLAKLEGKRRDELYHLRAKLL